jgi:hypothetical protein
MAERGESGGAHVNNRLRKKVEAHCSKRTGRPTRCVVDDRYPPRLAVFARSSTGDRGVDLKGSLRFFEQLLKKPHSFMYGRVLWIEA